MTYRLKGAPIPVLLERVAALEARLGSPPKGPYTRHPSSAFQARDNRLRRAHALGKLFLRQAGANAGGDQFAGEGEFALGCGMGLLIGRFVQPSLVKIGNFRPIDPASLARRVAVSMALLGVFCVFLTKA
jgi:hypothetical protein